MAVDGWRLDSGLTLPLMRAVVGGLAAGEESSSRRGSSLRGRSSEAGLSDSSVC